MSGETVWVLWLIGIPITMGVWWAMLTYRDESVMDHPEILAALLWPVAAVVGGIYWITLNILRRHSAAVESRRVAAAEQARLLREAGFEP